ncbi:MAG: sensor histidine kinase [Lentimicrobium sp.]
MKNLSKLAWIRLMMIAALILLTGFTLHWLNMQYKERQSMLFEEIGEAWSDSQKQMIDSMLLKEYIEPALDTSTKFDFRFEFNTDSIHTMIQGRESTTAGQKRPSLTLPAGKSQIIVKIADSVDVQGIEKKSGQTYVTRDLVLQGVKLFVDSHIDSSGKRPDLSASWEMKPDTSQLRNSFVSRLKNIDPHIQINWEIDSSSDSSGRRQIIKKYTMVTGNTRIEAGVAGYRLVILRDIWPQLIFALLLLLLTATAFILSFRSLKSQIALNNQRNDFIRNMSHELKTPVATVKVALEALKNFNRRNDPLLMDEYLNMATAETNRLEMLISRVMNISASNGELIRPNPEPTNIGELIREVLLSFRPRIEAEKATIILNLPDETIAAEIDRLHLQGVILNLIDNSLKYSIPPAEVEIGLSSDKNVIRISVADRGIGIPAEYRSRIFEKFFRVPTGDLHNVKGYGLGLSYAEMVMKQHGGSISFHEREGGGSIFELILPITTK